MLAKELEEEVLALLLVRLQRNIIPFHEEKLTNDPYTLEKWKRELKDSVCFFADGKQCSIRCEWFSFCDECDKPFCNLAFKDPIYGGEVRLCRKSGETLCEDCHDLACDCYEEEGGIERL